MPIRIFHPSSIDGNMMRGDGGDAAPAVALHESCSLTGRVCAHSPRKPRATRSSRRTTLASAAPPLRTQGLPKGVTN
ncbi:hypothetical protein BD626DRAFT_577950 [Schizophyllum amplum]|uniref:Uncharacterized protein n=1 Tax=Schizophyllum amplum TaxID=97359 RepID=A0A550BSA0_9AGAR|nr:hypothetical protein BD626DRAFT_577950 [Auriculariopsis ampla]